MKKLKKIRADSLLVTQGLFETRSKAQVHILAEEIFFFNPLSKQTEKVMKSSDLFLEDTLFSIKNKDPYVGRGAHKLLGALNRWTAIKPYIANARCIDIGSSTGGFTQVLLEYKALKVIALDVGTNQLHHSLRTHDKVVSIEKQHVLKTNDFFWKSKNIKTSFNIAVTDLSFISLDKVILHASPWLSSGAHWILLVKPQFELEASKTPQGIVKEEKHRIEALNKIKKVIDLDPSLILKDTIDCPLTGTQGNKEYLFWVQKK